MQRIEWMDAAKGIAIVGIVLIHAQSLAPAASPAAGWILGHLVVSLPVFFLVSGIVSGRSLAARDAGRGQLVARVLPLAYLYLLWQPVVFGYRVLDDSTAGTTVDLAGELARVAAAPIRPNGEIWYLWALAIHLVIIWSTRRLPTVVVLAPAAVIGAFCIGWGRTAAGDTLWHLLGPGLQGLPQYAFFTLAGARLAPFVLDRVRRATWSQTLSLTAGWLALGWAHDVALPAASGALGVLQVVTGTAATVAIAGRIGHFAAPLRFLGRWSVVPYLTHTAVIVVVLAVASVLGAIPRLTDAPGLTVASLTVIGTVAALALFWPARTTRLRFAFEMPSNRRSAVQHRAPGDPSHHTRSREPFRT